MGYFLHNDKKEFSFRINIYPAVLQLALEYGWTPKGTTIDPELAEAMGWDSSQDPGYTSMDGQQVTPEDAINLAKALELALKDIPTLELLKNVREPEELPKENPLEALEALCRPPTKTLSELLQMFSGEKNRAYLKEFITFCQEGSGFQIS